jgi:hypothetical protein
VHRPDHRLGQLGASNTFAPADDTETGTTAVDIVVSRPTPPWGLPERTCLLALIDRVTADLGAGRRADSGRDVGCSALELAISETRRLAVPDMAERQLRLRP